MLKKLGNRDEWLRLVVYENWDTTFYLVPPKQKVKIDYNTPPGKYQQLSERTSYDIKLPNGKIFAGCKVSINEHHSRGMGGMSEDSSSSEAFFGADGLTIKLKSGYLMRANENVTARRNEISRRQEVDEKLADLRREERGIKKQITKLLKKRR